MTAHSSRLNVRLAPQSGESLRGYLLRLSSANGLRPRQCIATVTGIGAALAMNELPLSCLAEAIGQPEEAFERSIGYRKVLQPGRVGANVEYRGCRAPLLNAMSAGGRYCPLCLSEALYLRAEWEVWLFGCCSAHGMCLLEHCPACRRPLKFSRWSLEHCECGASLLETAPVPAGQDLLYTQQAIDHYMRILGAHGNDRRYLIPLLGTDPTLELGARMTADAGHRWSRRIPTVCSTATARERLGLLWRAHGNSSWLRNAACV